MPVFAFFTKIHHFLTKQIDGRFNNYLISIFVFLLFDWYVIRFLVLKYINVSNWLIRNHHNGIFSLD
jgi:hypothetical protein